MKFEGTENQAKKCKIILEEELKENIVIPFRKEQTIQYNLTFMIKKAYGKQRKILDAKVLNKQIADFHFKMHDSNESKQNHNHTQHSNSRTTTIYRAMPFGTKHQPIYFATAMEPIMQQLRMKTEI
ncbi:MAG: hypothetical protein EZS28_039077 [Streblomastix strix]|uniref:Reverse transcriptase domain-containing protein n=1 Tax=Streblomastix strix TaxID=222440 RepID=A0A5J4U454_9EUKA|nr:MAG: hypothetical protein EZS28_039077 [Streblomastix strix]